MMAESPEHQYLSESLLSILNSLSNSALYSYRESERGKFDFACVLAETWECLLNGQTLWKHSEGIDKDLRTLLIASDAPLVTYVARDTTKHRSVFSEAIVDYRKIRDARRPKHLKVFWVPADFDADSETARHIVRSQLQHEVAEDILFNVLFGRLTPSRVAAIVWLSLASPGLELAILHSIATEGFVSLRDLTRRIDTSTGTLRDRIQRLQMSGLVLQERRAGQGYYVGSAGRAFLRLCAQVYGLVERQHPLAQESVDILKMLGIEPYENIAANIRYSDDWLIGTPESMFSMLIGKATMAARLWNVDWGRLDFRYSPDEQDPTRWLML